MTRRIFRSICLVAISIFLASAVLFMTVLYDYFSSVQQSQLKMQTDLAAKGVQDEGFDYLTNLNTQNYRITWIGTDGSVLYDSVSDADNMENHFEREEVKKALAEGYGQSSRYSSTLTERYLYSAERLSDGTVIRLSVTHSSLLVLTFGMLQPIAIIFAIAVIISAVLASRLAKRIVKPLNEINLDEPLENDGYEELSPLLRRIDTQQKQIKRQSDELRQKQLEFETLTGGMKEGIVLLNSTGRILSLNKAAMRLLETDHFCIGQDLQTVNRSLKIAEILRKAEKGQYAETVIELQRGKYQFDASPVLSDGKTSGIVLLMLDVTEKEKAEQMRREFTANVSHELKTPLQTISGCAELLANGIVKQEDVMKFGAQISTEAQRMIRLVEDIIKLSHLDEGAVDMQRETVDLYALAENTLRSLRPEAETANVSLSLDGDHAKLYVIPQLVSGIIFNLCDNAIKYNRENGSVSVEIRDEDDKVILSVADTGIGIPEEHQERIFERFYRVDKSHSKEIGGTGLGLSIVKHAARLHDATIELHSVVDGGTTVTVTFPKK
ncbi:MAG: ATP-binding protein [Lachnospiraceae bacterium]|nr:ATP-binding protein [Lachnospiraceae bacterium]